MSIFNKNLLNTTVHHTKKRNFGVLNTYEIPMKYLYF